MLSSGLSSECIDEVLEFPLLQSGTLEASHSVLEQNLLPMLEKFSISAGKFRCKVSKTCLKLRGLLMRFFRRFPATRVLDVVKFQR